MASSEPARKRRRCTDEDGLLASPQPVPGLVSTSTSGTFPSCTRGLAVNHTTGAIYALGGYDVHCMSPDGQVNLLAGASEHGDHTDGVGDAARFGSTESQPYGLALSNHGDRLFVGDGDRVRAIDVATRTVSTLAGAGTSDGVGEPDPFTAIYDLVLCGETLYIADSLGIKAIEIATKSVTTFIEDGDVQSITASSDGATLYIGSDSHIRAVDVATRTVSNLAGLDSESPGYADGVGENAVFDSPYELVLSTDNATLYVSDLDNNRIRAIDIASRKVTTIAGTGNKMATDGIGVAAGIPEPRALSLDFGPAGTRLLFSSGEGLILRSMCVECQTEVSIPSSTFVADIAQLAGDSTLPQGQVSFVLGTRRVEHVTKALLCVRSCYFDTMLRSDLKCPEEVEVQETTFEAFDSLIKYLLTDQVTVDTAGPHAFETMDLARRYQLKRLELLCQQAIVRSLSAENVIALIDASHRLNHYDLVGTCRSFVLENSAAVVAADGVQRLESLDVAKGLLLDSMIKAACFEATQEKFAHLAQEFTAKITDCIHDLGDLEYMHTAWDALCHLICPHKK